MPNVTSKRVEEKCQFCGVTSKLLKRDAYPPIAHKAHHEVFCEKCVTKIGICGVCGKLELIDKLVFSEDNHMLYCHTCTPTLTVCDCCGKSTLQAQETKDGKKVCSSCLNENYYRCEICNEYEPATSVRIPFLTLLSFEGIPKIKTLIREEGHFRCCPTCFKEITVGHTPQEVRTCSFCGNGTTKFTQLSEDQVACVACSPHVHKCTDCGKYATNMATVNEKSLCYNCLTAKYVRCNKCNNWESIEDADITQVGGDTLSVLCKSCTDKGYYYCEGCRRLYSKSQATRSKVNPRFCKSCEDATVGACSCCSIRKPFVHYSRRGFDSGIYCCDDCVSTGNVGAICSYSYKPKGIFYGAEGGDSINKTLFIGFENEIELINPLSSENRGLYRHVACGAVLRGLNEKTEHVYVKKDGSLGYGFEIVSHPMTEEYYHSMDWSKMFPEDTPFVKAAPSTGNHIHMSKAAFSNAQVYKLLHFFNSNPNFINLISERTPNGYCQSVKKETFVEKAKNKSGHERDQVNMIPEHTIELRCFRGASTVEAFHKNVEFAFAIYAFTRKARLTELTERDFCKFVGSNKERFLFLYNYLVTNGKI